MKSLYGLGYSGSWGWGEAVYYRTKMILEEPMLGNFKTLKTIFIVFPVNITLSSTDRVVNTTCFGTSVPSPRLVSSYISCIICSNIHESRQDPPVSSLLFLCYLCNKPWRSIGIWVVQDPTYSRQSAHSGANEPYAPAALYSEEIFSGTLLC
jgi:hypothetical protein